MSSRGINAELLVAAAEYDLYGPSASVAKTGDHRMFAVERLRDLCSCLLTFKCISGREDGGTDTDTTADTDTDASSVTSSVTTLVPDDGYKVFTVSISHYTVMEFLVSSYLLSNPSISVFSLSPAKIQYEFATSVFRQALAAETNLHNHDDPNTSVTDWETDREAYCLTLGCALAFMGPSDLDLDIEAGEADRLAELVLQYFNPINPHFRRFRGIQRRIALDPLASGVYYLGALPSGFLDSVNTSKDSVGLLGGGDDEAGDDNLRTVAGKTLLCMLSMSLYRYRGSLVARCISLLVRFSGVRNVDELMNVRVRGFKTVEGWHHRDWDLEPTGQSNTVNMTVADSLGSLEIFGGDKATFLDASEGMVDMEGTVPTYFEEVFEGTVREALSG